MAENDPLGKNWKLWGGILAFIVAVLVAGLIFFPRNTPQPEATTTDPAPSVPVETAYPSASPSVSKPVSGDCSTLSTDKSLPNDAPDTEWKRHPAGMLLPISTEHGPAAREGNFWRCFSRTPTGAVLAGFTLVIDFSAGREIEAAADSMSRQRLFSEQGSATSKEGFPPLLGYRVMNSSDDNAIVEYLSKTGEQYAAMSVNLVWSKNDNDWRLDLSTGEPTWNLVSDPSSYTDFK